MDLVLTGLDRMPVLGSEILAESMRMVLGGASAIFASGVARLGHEVDFIGRTGDDDLGRFCRQALASSGVSVDGLQTSRLPTGATVVLSTREDRALVTHLGAIADLAYGDLPRDLFAGRRHLHLTSYFLQLGLRGDFPRLMREARHAGLTVSFDPNSDPAQRWSPEIWEVMELADVVFVNEEEALAITSATSVTAALTCIAERVRCAVIKRGSRGAIAARGKERVSAPAFPVAAVDTTGAGDSFAAGFVHGALAGASLAECLRMGNAAGALSTTAVGGTAGQPTREQLLGFLRSQETVR